MILPVTLQPDDDEIKITELLPMFLSVEKETVNVAAAIARNILRDGKILQYQLNNLNQELIDIVDFCHCLNLLLLFSNDSLHNYRINTIPERIDNINKFYTTWRKDKEKLSIHRINIENHAKALTRKIEKRILTINKLIVKNVTV